MNQSQNIFSSCRTTPSLEFPPAPQDKVKKMIEQGDPTGTKAKAKKIVEESDKLLAENEKGYEKLKTMFTELETRLNISEEKNKALQKENKTKAIRTLTSKLKLIRTISNNI